ncbi:uncharacterized protein LOC127138338 isoform X1 [Lathyrus oleraceus]|uniref:uncharacterized protein LOC127138338 isoform X1 n=1 Tax=Pisum sativum TaxID=3888 RepID=UPI001FC50EBB|nr:uncharacterized protein LOC127138338 isoform X1 [Pisum sativum]
MKGPRDSSSSPEGNPEEDELPVPSRYEHKLIRQVKGLAPEGDADDFVYEDVLQPTPVFNQEESDKYIENLIKKRILENDLDDVKRAPKVQVIDPAASASSQPEITKEAYKLWDNLSNKHFESAPKPHIEDMSFEKKLPKADLKRAEKEKKGKEKKSGHHK